MIDEQPDEFTEWLDRQSTERIQVARERAERRDTDWWDDDSFALVLLEEVYKMWDDDTKRSMTERGLLEPHVLDNGEIGHTLTERGQEAYEPSKDERDG